MFLEHGIRYIRKTDEALKVAKEAAAAKAAAAAKPLNLGSFPGNVNPNGVEVLGSARRSE